MSQPNKITVPKELDQAMRTHLEPAYPNEGCGIMIGSIDGDTVSVSRVVGAENQNKERGQDRFELDPLFYAQTERNLETGENVVGFFHSHPDCPEIASETDRQFALYWPDFSWIIYRVNDGQSENVRCWIVDETSEQFVEMQVSIT